MTQGREAYWRAAYPARRRSTLEKYARRANIFDTSTFFLLRELEMGRVAIVGGGLAGSLAGWWGAGSMRNTVVSSVYDRLSA